MGSENPVAAIGIRITVLEGGAAGAPAEYVFPPDRQRIVMGRDPAVCDVVFATETRLRGVGNEHLALVRSLGRYQLDLNTENMVLLDGAPAFEDQEITETAELRLGDGARVRIVVVDHRPATVIPGGRRQRQVGEVARQTRRLAWTLGGIGAVAVAAVAGAIPWLLKPGPVPDAVLALVAKSVYVVVIQSEDGGEWPTGTAWIGPGPRVFTNAHVAELFGELEPGETLLIRSSVPPYRGHEVTGVTLHPGYKLFKKITQAARPSFKTTGRWRQSLEFAPACDVAVMAVTDSTALAPPLPVADRRALLRLDRGMPLALVGFPSEGLSPTQVRKPVPLSPGGTIQRMTDFLEEPNTPEANLLIQHSIPSAGGASGSPVVDVRGRVVGLHNAGNDVSIVTGAWIDDSGPHLPSIRGAGSQAAAPKLKYSTQRSPHAALVKYAQRADLVHDFLEGDLEQRTAGYAAEWRATLGRVPRGPDVELDVLQTVVNKITATTLSPHLEDQTLFIEPPVAGGTKAEGAKSRCFGAGHHAVIVSSPEWSSLTCSAARGDWYVGHATSFDGVAVLEFTLDDPAEIRCTVTLDDLPRDRITREHTVVLQFVGWEVDPRSFGIRRAIFEGRARARDLQFMIAEGEPEAVFETDGLELDTEETDGRTGEAYGSVKVRIPLEGAGTYLVIGQTERPCNLDLAVAGQDREWWERDETLTDTPWILHRSDGKSGSISVVLYADADRPSGSAALKVFRWALRGEQAAPDRISDRDDSRLGRPTPQTSGSGP